MIKLLSIAASILSLGLLASCESTLPSFYRLEMNAESKLPHSAGSFRVEPIKGSYAEADPDWEEYKRYLAYMLSDKGLYLAERGERADYVIQMGYDAGPLKKHHESIEQRVAGEFQPVFDPVTGEQIGGKVMDRNVQLDWELRYYVVRLRVVAFGSEEWEAQAQVMPVWSAGITSHVPNERLDRVIPVLIASLKGYLAVEDAEKATLPYQPKRPEVTRMKRRS
ncbi:hypothetical protein IEN85_20355 [Pelagicoccus sp. NFK12]|uniref:DUF4136 domain-containing protein n=1 Tax=Pelagicoccus enzymogenes TaxID=2773457 RepID=A0A927FDU6_9BACT|nr:hypothetical protein [Pelagicoccus enzymogenes]MBD5781865.1 hypothetical protein [Pelagicoccus enzymogenes]